MKTKKIISLLTAAALSAVSLAAVVTASAAEGDDLINTGHMEYAGADNIPYYWYAKTDGDAADETSVGRSEEQVHGGTYSLKVSGRNSVNSGAGNYFTQPEVGKSYRITAYIYPTVTDTFYCRMSSSYWKNAGMATGECIADQWNEITADVTLTEWETGTFHIYSANSNADFYVDDVSVVELADTPTEPSDKIPAISTREGNLLSGKTFTVAAEGSVTTDSDDTYEYYSMDYTGGNSWSGLAVTNIGSDIEEYTEYEYSMMIYNPYDEGKNYQAKISTWNGSHAEAPVIYVPAKTWTKYEGTMIVNNRFNAQTYADFMIWSAWYQQNNFYASDIYFGKTGRTVNSATAVTPVMDGESIKVFEGAGDTRSAAYYFDVTVADGESISGIELKLYNTSYSVAATATKTDTVITGGTARIGVIVDLTDGKAAPEAKLFAVNPNYVP